MIPLSRMTSMVDRIDILSHFPKMGVSEIIEVLILTFFIYYIAKSFRGTRVWLIFKGTMVLLALYIVAYICDFSVITLIFQNVIWFIGIAVVVILQPEIRKFIEQLATKNLNIPFTKLVYSLFRGSPKTEVINKISDFSVQELVKACSAMSKVNTGALIVIGGTIPLNDYINSGLQLNADITSQLLINIFEKNTPLHDGAIIIQDNKIVAATCYLPLSENNKISKNLGTRHRAAIGMSEATDAYILIVSEENGAMSIAHGGSIKYNLTRDQLAEELRKAQASTAEEVKKQKSLSEMNLPIKLACLFGAFCMWLMIISASNPVTTTVIRGVPVEYINTEVVTELGKAYEVIGEKTVNVTIRDRKDIVDDVSIEDIRVIADFKKISYVDSITLEVQIPAYPDAEVYLSENTVNIVVEDVIATEVDVEVNKVGEPNENYYISDIELSADTVIISGSKSIINTIGKVIVNIDESKLSEDASLKLKPIVLDKNGAEISSSKLKISAEEIEANIKLFNTKTVPLKIETVISNKVLESIIDNLVYEVNEVCITGPDEVLDKYNELSIQIPLDITLGEINNKDFIKNISLQNYIPEELLLTPQYNKINLHIKFKDFVTEALQFESSDILIENLPDNMKATINKQEITIDLVSTDESLSDVTIDKLIPYISLKDVKPGEHLVTVKYKEMRENIFTNTKVTVTVESKE